MNSLLRRISQDVAALDERANTWLQIEDLVIKWLKGTSSVTAEEAIASYRAVEAIGEEAIGVFWVEGKVEVEVAIISNLWQLNTAIEVSVCRKLSVIFVAAKVERGEEAD